MALIRAEQQGSRPLSRVYDGIVEAAADLQSLPLTGETGRVFGPGSLMYCLADGKLYALKSDRTWGAVQ